MWTPIELETERLRIRSFTPADLDDLHGQLSDPDVMRFYQGALSREGSEKWLRRVLTDYESDGHGMVAFHLKETGEYVGQAGVMHRLIYGGEHHYLAYLIRKKFWGQGYASEAVRKVLDYGFGTLGISKVEALIRPDNTRSIRLAERLGMCREGSIQHQGHEHCVYVLTRWPVH